MIEATPRTPETFRFAQLAAMDFDQTVAFTREPSPNNLGVDQSYERTVEDKFGADALLRYRELGGLRNRAPLEVVAELNPDADPQTLLTLTDDFVAHKLGLVINEIGLRGADGKVWPRLVPGFVGFYDALLAARQDGRLVDDIIISSGHQPYIEKVFETHGLEQPGIILAEEQVRALDLKVGPEQLVKPSPLLMQLGVALWRARYTPEGHRVVQNEPSRKERERIVYIGDDLLKDGQFAKKSGVQFNLIDRHNSELSWLRVIHALNLSQYAGKVAL